MRMMGLASGLDTDSIIQQTLRLHQMKIDSRMRARTILEWRQATQTSVRDQIQSFRNTFLTTLGSSGMLSPGTYSATKATVTGTNAGAVSVRVSPSGKAGTFRIDQILQLARGATLTSEYRASTSGQGFSMNARLDSLSLAKGPIVFGAAYAQAGSATITQSQVEALGDDDWGDATSTFTVGDNKVTLTKTDTGVTYSITDSDGIETDTGILGFDDETGIAKITVGDQEIDITQAGGQYTVGGQTLRFYQTTTVNGAELTRAEGDTDKLAVFYEGARLNFAGDASITIDGTSITLKSNMTISSMISTVNSKLEEEGKDVRMSYNSLADRFSFESSSMVEGHTFDAKGQALAAFGFDYTSGDTFTSGVRQGAEIKVTVNGVSDTLYSDTNVFTIGDATVTVNNTTTATDGPITVNLQRDATEALAKIKAFIDAYNSIIQRIETLTRERKKPNEVSYGPLTDEEKSVMSDKQVEEWEAIARKGILRNDPGLQNLATNLRRELFAAIDATGLSPQEIGISTGRFDSGTGGQIVLDEEKLKAVLEEDPERVAKIFAGTEDNRGLLWRMNDHMSTFVSRTQPRTLKSLEDSIKKASEQMTRMQERMYKEEDRLYKQFAAMETALSKMQSQGDWFAAMLGNTKK